MNKGSTLLIIDDDEGVVSLLEAMLEEYKTRSYSSVETAVTNEDLSKVSLIIVDINLPGKSGIELLEQINKEYDFIPVILITGHSQIDVAASAVKHGAADLILKPFSHKQILLAVERALFNKELKEQNRELLYELQEKNIALEKLNAQAEIRNAKLENDLDMASNLQRCLYPQDLPVIEGVSIASHSCSVEKISGDFYYFENLRDNRFAMIIADISGHGVTAALFSAMVKASISSIDLVNKSPSQIIKEMNGFLIKAQIKPSYNYLTLCYFDIDLLEKKVSFCNAGLPAPVLVKQDGNILELKANGPFVGIFDVAVYKEDTFMIEKGDKIILFTDGVYERPETIGNNRGYQNVLSTLNLIKYQPVDVIIDSLYETVENRKDKNDDATYLGLEFHF